MSKAARINSDCIALLTLFKPCNKDMYNFDFWMNDEDNELSDWNKYDTFEKVYDFMAKEFLDGLEDEWCIAFLEALRRRIDVMIQEDRTERKKNEGG